MFPPGNYPFANGLMVTHALGQMIYSCTIHNVLNFMGYYEAIEAIRPYACVGKSV